MWLDGKVKRVSPCRVRSWRPEAGWYRRRGGGERRMRRLGCEDSLGSGEACGT